MGLHKNEIRFHEVSYKVSALPPAAEVANLIEKYTWGVQGLLQ
jgi:hypothetical protein